MYYIRTYVVQWILHLTVYCCVILYNLCKFVFSFTVLVNFFAYHHSIQTFKLKWTFNSSFIFTRFLFISSLEHAVLLTANSVSPSCPGYLPDTRSILIFKLLGYTPDTRSLLISNPRLLTRYTKSSFSKSSVTYHIHEASSFSNSSCLWMTLWRMLISSWVSRERSGEGGSTGLTLPEVDGWPERTDFVWKYSQRN